MDILNMLKGPAGKAIMGQLDQFTGSAQQKQTNQATGDILSQMMGAISKNTSTPQGAEQLSNALDKDHDGSILSNLSSFLGGGGNNQQNQNQQGGAGNLLNQAMSMLGGGGNQNQQNWTQNSNNNASSRTVNGASILNHVFGGNQQQVANDVSQKTGIDQSSAMNLMSKLAPMVMGYLGQQKKSQNLDSNGMASFVNQQNQQMQNQAQQKKGGILGMLDQDGDGDFMDDVGGMLKKLF